jgi:tetratricopeptide (TPR) repeat protein
MSDLSTSEEFRRALAEGGWLLRTDHPEQALEKLLPLYEQAPGNPDVAINLGGAYILLRKWNKAERVLSKAADLHPDNAMIWTNLGAAHLGDLELAGPQQQRRAIHAYERALNADPKAPNVHYHLGLIYRDQRNWERAAEYFAQALQVDPQDRDAQRWLERVTRLVEEDASAEVSSVPAADSSPAKTDGEQAG